MLSRLSLRALKVAMALRDQVAVATVTESVMSLPRGAGRPRAPPGRVRQLGGEQRAEAGSCLGV